MLHPDQVRLTERAAKLKQDPLLVAWKRRFNEDARPIRVENMRQHLSSAPIVLVAIDLSEEAEKLLDELRVMAGQVLNTMPDARLACLNVLKQNRVALDTTLDEDGTSKHLNRLVALKNWANSLKLPQGKISFHVLEAVDPAAAILDYARTNQVDHILMGARANSTMRALLGSVSGEVAAQAPCTVTVVRSRASKG